MSATAAELQARCDRIRSEMRVLGLMRDQGDIDGPTYERQHAKGERELADLGPMVARLRAHERSRAIEEAVTSRLAGRTA